MSSPWIWRCRIWTVWDFSRLLMRTQPKPVVMISSWTKENSEIALKALTLGAVDFVTKPPWGCGGNG